MYWFVLKVLQLLGDLACFATSIKAGGHYNGLIIAVTVFSFIYNIFSNCLGWFGMKGTVDTEDVRAYRGFILGGGTLFFLLYWEFYFPTLHRLQQQFE